MTTPAKLAAMAEYSNVHTGDQAFGCPTCAALYMAWANAAPRLEVQTAIFRINGQDVRLPKFVDTNKAAWADEWHAAKKAYQNHASKCKARQAWQLKIERELREMEMK